MDNEDIAITGLSARFPQADDLAEFKEKLYAGFDFITADEARWPRGPSVTVDTACSSTITALNQAILALRCGQCEAAIVAGCMISLKPTTAVGFMKLGMLSPDGMCKAFDSR
ncbi:hypothetical protein V5799_007203, partial [Amblyomma americanum]